jgi:hypothetical protein
MRRLLCCTIALLLAGMALADDGPMTRKNVSNTPELETEFAAIRMLPLYVPAQSSAGELLTEGIEYLNVEGAVVETRYEARPLIVHYTDGHVEGIDEEGYGGFPGHGQRDAFGAVSLDDGATWKRSNLSQSADSSSIKIKDGRRRVPYYGDVLRTFAASDGNKVLIAWVSKFCGGGSPGYAMSDEERTLLAGHLITAGTITDSNGYCTDGDPLTPCTYLEDSFGVAGSQGVQSADDLADEGFPLVGDYPYSCTWAARGVILPPEATGLETSSIVWFKAERLSSGTRSSDRPEAACVKGAGCVVTWQEDPDGVRPGGGEGPGEGWAGAIAHHETDTWYSFIDWDDFALVSDDGSYGTFYETTGDLAAWVADNDSGSPKAAVPMSIPVRLTDNAMCTSPDSKLYCSVDYDGNGTADFCASTVPVTIETPEGPTQDVLMCVTEDGRLLRGNTAATRARLSLHGYSSTIAYDFDLEEGEDNSAFFDSIDRAWFSMAYEENKGLGEDGEEAEVSDDPALKIDMGKNIWYHPFDMHTPELVSQGLMLNQPSVYPDDWSDPTDLLTQDISLGCNFYQIDPDPIYETQAGIDTTLYQTEIARRSSPITQNWYDAGATGTVAFQVFKQGIIRRGGPADIMGRRFVMPTGGDEQCTDYYSLCTTPYELCTTTYEWCETEPVCVANAPNPDYDFNKGLCKKDPTLPRCFEFIDGDGSYTNEPETCTEPACYEPESGWCDVTLDQCDSTALCDDSLTSCPDVLADNQTCGALEASCTTVGACPAVAAENQECVWERQICSGDFDATVDNPYDYANMVCETADGDSAWAFTDGSNPRYVKGLCAAPAVNLSANTILLGETCADAASCLDAFPFSDYFDDLDMQSTEDPISKILTWVQYGAAYGGTVTDTAANNLDDASWENPYDVAKGHRGFLAGDMLMVLYAWSPNWQALTEAHDAFNLYIRRSFDGGQTFTTLPSSFIHTDGITYAGNGTTTCEWMYFEGWESGETPLCTDYLAGAFEQARNVSMLLGSHVTIIDPRYAPTTASITEASVSTASLPLGFSAPLYEDDTRDPSRYFIVYETGANSPYDVGEAEPLNLYYSRAVDWGDDYLVWQDVADAGTCLPSADAEDDFDLTGFCNEFDALEGSQFAESGEAAVTASPGGMFMFADWNQGDFDIQTGEATGSDAWFRRVLFVDDYVPPEE